MRNCDGATVVEYGLLIGIMTVAILIGLTGFSNALNNLYITVSGAQTTALAKL